MTPMYAANRAFREKNDKFVDAMKMCHPNSSFIPLILEIFGALHPAFRDFISRFVPELAMKLNIDSSVLFCFFLKKISMSLARSTAQTIIAHRDSNYSHHPTFRHNGYPNFDAFNSEIFFHTANK